MKRHDRIIFTPNDVVIMEYSNPENIKCYQTIGLWISEEMLIDQYFKFNCSVLDIGCGAGRTTIALAKKGFCVTGIDIVPEMIRSARRQALQHKVDVEFTVMDASMPSFADESFQDVLFSFNGFEHISGKEKRNRLIQEVYRILKPGGFFILTARSGLAFGKRWIVWIWIYIRHSLLKTLGIGNPYLEMGDMIFRGSYHHYLSPFQIRKDLRENGFAFELFNSRSNLERNKKASLFTNFSADKCLFYVAQKPL